MAVIGSENANDGSWESKNGHPEKGKTRIATNQQSKRSLYPPNDHYDDKRISIGTQ